VSEHRSQLISLPHTSREGASGLGSIREDGWVGVGVGVNGNCFRQEEGGLNKVGARGRQRREGAREMGLGHFSPLQGKPAQTLPTTSPAMGCRPRNCSSKDAVRKAMFLPSSLSPWSAGELVCIDRTLPTSDAVEPRCRIRGDAKMEFPRCATVD
jgi:hypothetical protein